MFSEQTARLIQEVTQGVDRTVSRNLAILDQLDALRQKKKKVGAKLARRLEKIQERRRWITKK